MGPLHALKLHEADQFAPLRLIKIEAVLVVCVQSFDDDWEWFDTDLAHYAILIETAAESSIFRLHKTLFAVLVKRIIVGYLACRLY